MPTLTVIVGSTRPGRAGQPIAEWFAERARTHAGFDVEVADLAQIGLPLLDEPNHPRLGQYTQQHTKDWSAIIDRAVAAFIVPAATWSIRSKIWSSSARSASWTSISCRPSACSCAV